MTTIEMCNYLQLPKDLGLYEIFSFYFDSKILEDAEMLNIIETAFFRDSKYYFCVKLGVSFCWFIVDDGIKIQGKLQFSDTPNLFTTGKFIKRLRYELARSGANLNKVKFLLWDDKDLVGFENYILVYDRLEDFFNKIEGCKGLSCVNIMKLLSRVRNSRGIGINYNAENFVKCLIDGNSILNIKEENGILISKNVYYKDYTTCICQSLNNKKCSYGIILDVEGVKGDNGSLTNGVSEVGGIIYCRFDNILLNMRTFIFDRKLINESMQEAISEVREYSENSKTPINITVFGTSDVIMLKHSLNKHIYKQLRFFDCRPSIINTYKLDGLSLSKIATKLGVALYKPKHNPQCDAKTLFNILAKLLEEHPELQLKEG